MRKFYLCFILWISFISIFAEPVITNGILTAWPDASGSIIIPSTATSISDAVFSNNAAITSVTIPNSINSIGKSAFSGCHGLVSVTIGHADSISTASVSIVGDAFLGCQSITELVLNKDFTFSGTNSPFQNLQSVSTILIGNGSYSISPYAFSGCTGLKLVRLGQSNSTGNSAIAVSADAFSGCTNFASLELNRSVNITGYSSPFTTISSLAVGSGVTSIGNQAFSNCLKIESVVLPSSVQKIGNSAFEYCAKLQSATFPGVSSIGDGAFESCSALTSIVIPNTVKIIQEAVFYECTGLTSVSLGNSIIQIGGRAFSGCDHLSSIVIPNSVQVIDENAFKNCSALTSVTLGTSLSDIRSYAFSGCSSLQSIQFPSLLTTIEDYAFENCKGLTSLFIPSTIRSVGTSTFSNCSSITAITIGNANDPGLSLKFSFYPFTGCTGVTALVLNKDITDDPSSSPFMSLLSLGSITISNHITHLNTFAFYGCSKIISVVIPNSVTSIGEAAFQGCSSLTDVKLPANINNLSNQIFSGCTNLKSLYIPSTVISIGSYAFYQCTSLKSLTIPKTVIAIGAVAFSGCTGLTDLTSVNPVAPPVGSSCFTQVSTSTCVLHVPAGCKTVYNKANQWMDFMIIVDDVIADSTQIIDSTSVYTYPIIGSLKSVNINAGGLSAALTSTELATVNTLIISGSVNAADFLILRDNMPALNVLDLSKATIEAYNGTMGTAGYVNFTYLANAVPVNAFYNQTTHKGKSGLIYVILPSSVKTIGDNAFYQCSGLRENFTLLPSLTSIGSCAYLGCSGLTGSLTIPASVTFIGDQAFYECNGLVIVNLLSSVTSIGLATFGGCSKLMVVNLPTTVISIKSGAFYDCGRLFSINIPSSVTIIEDNAFAKCTGFTTITLPSSLTFLGDFAFAGCYSLQTITIPPSITSLANSLLIDCYSLGTVSLPSTLTSINSNSFGNCRNLSSIYAYPTTPIVLTDNLIFYSVNKSTCILYVPAGSLTAYRQANQWKDFLNIREMGVTDVNSQLNNSISLYPNPAIDGFHINGLIDSGMLTLTNLNGSVLLTKQITGNDYISISAFPKGLYIVKLITNEGTIEKKIVKD